MTTDRRHSRAQLRRSLAPEKILAAGLATATCVGLVGVIGARTVSADSASTKESAAPAIVDATPTGSAAEPTTSTGLTETDLDVYAAQLAAERDTLDAYRDKLVIAGNRLQRQAARQAARATAAATGQGTGPAAKPASQPNRPASSPAAAQAAAPAKPKPVAKPKPKPVAKPAPKPAAAPKPQNTKGS